MLLSPGTGRCDASCFRGVVEGVGPGLGVVVGSWGWGEWAETGCKPFGLLIAGPMGVVCTPSSCRCHNPCCHNIGI
jgi:hypothetical protein